jgi:hypothetical protein
MLRRLLPRTRSGFEQLSWRPTPLEEGVLGTLRAMGILFAD